MLVSSFHFVKYDMTEAISRNVEFKNKRTALNSISAATFGDTI